MMVDGWQTAPLGEFLAQRKEFFTINDFTRYKRARVQLHGRGIVLRDDVDGVEVKTKEQQAARTGEFLVAEIDAKVGGFGIMPYELDGAIVSSHYLLFEINEQKCLREWLDWFIRSGMLEDQVTAHGSTNYSAIRPSHVLKYQIPLPPLTEQRRIVRRIEALAWRVAESQSLRREASEEAKVLLQSRTNQILEEKAGTGNWKWAYLPDFVSSTRHAIKRGPFGSHLRKEFFVPSGYKVYEQKHAIYGDFTAGRYFIDDEKFKQLKSFEVKPGDIIISCSGTIGKVAIVPETAKPGIINQALLKLTLDTKKIDRQFFKIVFESDFIKQEVAAMSLGSAMKNIGSVKILKKIKFPLPPLEEQRRLVAYLDGLQAQVSALRAAQSETEEWLSALMPSILYKAFKGEL
jgi:type I restriction enzyme S subunit